MHFTQILQQHRSSTTMTIDIYLELVYFDALHNRPAALYLCRPYQSNADSLQTKIRHWSACRPKSAIADLMAALRIEHWVSHR